jgi:two-component system NarL family sensor kinase
VLLRAAIAAGVALGCVGLSRIQRSRVRTIGRLVETGGRLLTELTDIEQRERRVLSEHLHDGALQYVLAARHDLDEARETGDPEAFARLEEALGESSRLLRSTVAELHPAVLARAGLPAALRDLARTAAARGGFTAEVVAEGWPDELRTSADALLYRTARELLANVAEHAKAATATVRLSRSEGWARLEVADDGVGLPARPAEDALGRGHIGLASHTVRIDAAGGRLRAEPGRPAGTVMTVELPCPPIGGPPVRPA